MAAEQAPNVASQLGKKAPGRVGNQLFAGISYSAGIVIMIVLAAVAGFLLWSSWDALTADRQALAEVGFMRGKSFWAYVAPLVFGTLLAAALALLIAVPLSTGVALFISHYAPRRLAQALGYLVDLLAAIPSVIYGLWGFLWLRPLMEPVYQWLTDNLGFIPLFAGYSAPGKNILTGGLVLAVMILPIITATMREVFLQTPRLQEEASLALGATRFEMIRQTVLPFGRSGMISASMLGLGRALGETMAVLMILSPGAFINLNILQAGQHQTIAANIAAQFREAFGLSRSVLFASGLVLFVLTFAVNMLARWIIARRAEFSGANA
ncbi:phosphate ABC transporter permease subunit PstC [Buchananella felis]|uniref:phosphate ABC transporter permease subunit PstC n=1 Tax=Buchananella felis TaxID=3231492 RepID=UPI0035284CBE